MSDEQKQVDKRTATERIASLENGLTQIYATANNMARDLLLIKDALKLLGNKVDSMVKASVRQLPINDEVLSQLMIENNIEEMKQKLNAFISRGILVAEPVVSGNSFVVLNEIDGDGKVLNPRTQIALNDLASEALRNKIKGSKIGDIIETEDNKLRVTVLESYEIVPPKEEVPQLVAVPEQAEEVAQEPAPAQEAAAVPAQETQAEAPEQQ